MSQEGSGRRRVFGRPKATDFLFLVALVAVAFFLKEVALTAWSMVTENDYIRHHLDKAAVTTDHVAPSGAFVGIKYRDLDSDGDLDSLVIWKNPEGYTIDIPILRDANGHFVFPTLASGTITPETALAQGQAVSYFFGKSGAIHGRIAEEP